MTVSQYAYPTIERYATEVQKAKRIPENFSLQSILEHASLLETGVVEYTVGQEDQYWTQE
jgi:hypothetical protein